eukprot:1958452-Rhodomonas_salina.1
MQASNQFVTLDQQAPSLVNSDIWDPLMVQQALEQNYAQPLDVDNNMTDPGTADGRSVPDDSDDNSPPSTQHRRAMDETSFATSVYPSLLKSGTSDLILRPNKRHSAVGGKGAVKRQHTGTTASAQHATEQEDGVDWDDCTDMPLDQVSDFELGNTWWVCLLTSNYRLTTIRTMSDSGQ